MARLVNVPVAAYVFCKICCWARRCEFGLVRRGGHTAKIARLSVVALEASSKPFEGFRVYELPYQMMLDGILKQLGIGLQSKALHHFVLVKCHCARLQVEHCGDFLHGEPLSQKL